ncbi:hypothetical protein FSW04_14195 [Baekduia soli]|uniref:Uncharacterized protein n=1 Tax=Baekduia soli TaxID=496014 RepID=A0A5B8U654_9ACTN|nr:hypothetical protein [Baekduia soli]QEC48609.1 hypothetical protein FSW04_14195 [Baekduia soli]
MPPSRCCRTCPRCHDCPVVLAAAARSRTRQDAVAALVDEVFAGAGRRVLPDPVLRTLEALDLARRGAPAAV